MNPRMESAAQSTAEEHGEISAVWWVVAVWRDVAECGGLYSVVDCSGLYSEECGVVGCTVRSAV